MFCLNVRRFVDKLRFNFQEALTVAYVGLLLKSFESSLQER